MKRQPWEAEKEERNWVVLVRKGNYSAFNGYRFTFRGDVMNANDWFDCSDSITLEELQLLEREMLRRALKGYDTRILEQHFLEKATKVGIPRFKRDNCSRCQS